MAEQTEFDFIVVGGGAAGCVLAARLAERGDVTVALVERGPMDRRPAIHVAGAFPRLYDLPETDMVFSEPDPSLGGRPVRVLQGRVIGGGSSIGAMVYMRGQRQDFDDWAERHGCAGWAYDDMLPVFRRHEANTRLDDAYHGTDGPVVVSDPAAPHPVSARAIDAAIAAGVPATQDFNGAHQEGAGWYQVYAHKGRRQSAAGCFLRPVLKRETLTVVTGATVQRLRIDGRRATAVELRDKAGGERILRARREIVLAAGAIQSPKILMLSGIGPAGDLNRLGIDVACDAPGVGANYHDHHGAAVTWYLDGIQGLDGQDRGRNALRNLRDYVLHRRGLLASTHVDAGACVDTTGSGRPDVQYNFAAFAPAGPDMPRLDGNAMVMNTTIMQTRSRGRLGLRSGNPADGVTILANALDDPRDLATLRRGVRMACRFYDQSPLREVLGAPIWPPAGLDMSDGSETFEAEIRARAESKGHPTGTCRMGPDAEAVTDLDLRVRGIDGLRVADASVMPAIVSGNTQAATLAIADRAAEALLRG